MATAARILLDGLAFPEGPRWRDDLLWFSDMHDLQVKTVDLAGRVERRLEVPGSPSGLGWLPDGRLLVVSMTDRRLLRRDPQGLVTHADLSALASHDCNDMVTDARGNSYVGNFGFDLHAPEPKAVPAELVLVTAAGEARVVARDMLFPNGSAITRDGRTLIVGESWGARLTAFDIEEDGGLANRRVWARLESAVPDGLCLDAEGAVWVASPTGNEVLRVHEGGRVSDRVAVSNLAIACMLGGPERRHLLICSSPVLRPDECRAQRAGRIEVCEVEVPGAGLP